MFGMIIENRDALKNTRQDIRLLKDCIVVSFYRLFNAIRGIVDKTLFKIY